MGDETKQLIYDQFMSNPAENNVRALAALHGLSIARVDAILRLKGLEEHWKKVSSQSLIPRASALYDESKSISLYDLTVIQQTLHAWLSESSHIIVTS